MKPKTKLLIPFFLFVLIIPFFVTQKVNAISYYNWVQNPSFVTYTNYIEDNGFESGGYNNGLVYGNWTGDMLINTDNPNTGLYAAKFSYYDNYLYYTFSDEYENNTLGADIEEFSWYQDGTATADYDLIIYYSDGTNTTYDGSADYGEYTKVDVTDEIEDNKYIWKINFVYQSGSGTGGSRYFDDFVLLVDDGEGQDEIVFGGNNYWQLGQTSSSYAPYFGHINTVFGRTDNTSCQLDSPYETYKIIQYIDFLDSDTIHYINLYIYGADVADGEGIKIKLLYSDGSTDEKTVLATGDGSSWEELNFGKSWIDSDKYITLFYIYPVFDGEAGSFNIDDVGIWCSIPYGYSKFQFTVSPQPIEKGSYDFDAYSQTTYTFTGYFYNVTDLSLSINGTYQLSDSFGLHTGTMTNGLFSLQLNQRTYTGSPYTLETLSVTIITDDEIFNVDISAYWYPVSGGAGETVREVTGDFLTNWFIYAIFLLVIPLSITVYVGGQFNTNPMLMLVTFLGSETLMTAISLSIGLVDLWFMLVVIIMDVLIILGLMKGRSY